MSLSRFHEENEDERQEPEPTFLSTIQEIMTIFDEEVLPKVEENTHLKLVNGLQLLYNLHTGSNYKMNFTTPPTPRTPTPRTPTLRIPLIPPTPPTTISATLANFNRVLSELDTTFNCWTRNTRSVYDNSVNPNNFESFRNCLNSEYREFSDYNRQMREALGYWRDMSLDEQRNIRWGPHINYPSRGMMESVVWGGPIDRIIVERSPDHPAEIYDVFYNN
jgi:hypothetical protein